MALTKYADKSSPNYHVFRRRVTSWEEAQGELNLFDEQWLLRGQRDARWSLSCSLDRKKGTTEALLAETMVKEQFEARAHLFLPTVREPENPLEWLALIQHHGGPTRLIDFSTSPLVAAFFALEEEGDAEWCAVWGIDKRECEARAVARLVAIDPKLELKPQSDIREAVSDQVRPDRVNRFVAPIVPTRLNSRLVLQQGYFLCLGDPGRDVFSNFDIYVADIPPIRIVKIEFPRNERGRALFALRRMNISRESLFPGLDGLAQGLCHLLAPRDWMDEAILGEFARPSNWPE